MPATLLVMLGGAVGAGARHLVGRWSLAQFGGGCSWGTLAVNLIGGLLMGVLVGSVPSGNDQARLLLGTGVLGGFTTFSAFSLELVGMAERGAWALAAGYALVSVIGAALALVAGLAAARALA